jgi:hypothetical protein
MATPLAPHDLDPNIHISLTDDPLDLTSTAALVRSPEAVAVVLFVGTYLPSPSTPFHSNPIHLTHAAV